MKEEMMNGVRACRRPRNPIKKMAAKKRKRLKNKNLFLRFFAAIPFSPGSHTRSNSVKPMPPVKLAGKSYANNLQLGTCKTNGCFAQSNPVKLGQTSFKGGKFKD
jgi:hypothetical protein